VGFNLKEVVLKMLPNVKQATIATTQKQQPGTLIYTDEYIIYSPLSQWGYDHKVSVTARRVCTPEDGDDSAKSMSILWKASGRYCGLGSDHTEVFQEKLPLYLGNFIVCSQHSKTR